VSGCNSAESAIVKLEMTNLNFDELSLEVQGHFEKQSYADGLDLLDGQAERFPEQRALIDYWRLCLAGRLDDRPRAYRLLKEGLEAGNWYSQEILRSSPSLKLLQGDPPFEQLVALSSQMQAADPARLLPLLVVHPEGRCGAGDEPCPLLLVLHGNDDTAQANLRYWGAAPAEGWLLALPQSKQAMWAGAYAWFSHESAAEQLEEHFESMVAQYAIDPERIVLGGLSMGGEVALWLALSGRMQARGFIVIGPGGPLIGQPEEWRDWIVASAGKGLRGAVILGEDDHSIPHQAIHELVEMMNSHDIPCELEVHPGLGHGYPTEFEYSLRRALDFIFEGHDN